MLELDILVLTRLTKLFGRDMAARRFGYILQVASNGAFQPTPTYASYAAAKAYVLSFGEALAYELRHAGVSCTVLAPGVTDTSFREVAGQRTTLYQRLVMMQSRDVVRIGVEAMLERKSSVVPGWANVVAAWGTRFLPRQWSAALAYRTMTMR
jgi:short-subunit dehydrogenase